MKVIDIIGILIAFPPVVFVVVYLLAFLFVKDSRKRIKRAADSTGILLVVAVYFIFQSHFQLFIGWWLILFFLIEVVMIAIICFFRWNEIDYQRIFVIWLRFNFLFFLLMYIILFIIVVLRGVY